MQVEVHGEQTLVRLTNADVAGEDAIYTTREQLYQLVYDGARDLVLDLKEATFLGSSLALAMLITLQKLVMTDGGVLVLRNPSPQTDELFRITRLSELFDIDRDQPSET